MANFTRSRCVIFTSIVVFLLHKKKATRAAIRYIMAGDIFVDGDRQHAQVFPGEDGAQTRCDGRVARNLQGSATIDGGAQIAQKRHAGRACFNVFAHLFAGQWFHAAVEILGEIGEQIAAFSRALRAVGSGALGLARGGSGLFG